MNIDYDQIAADYARNRHVHPEVLRHLIATASLDSSSRVLEIGCGTGNTIIALHDAIGCACCGIDPSPQMLAHARARSQRVQFQIAYAESIPFAAEQFTLAFSVDVIHHVQNREAYFREAYRLLHLGGRLCTVTDSDDIIRRRQPLSTYFPETVPLELARYPRLADLENFMAGVGFREMRQQTVEFQLNLTDISAFREKAFSALHLISEADFQRGLARLESDWQRTGCIPSVVRYVLLWGSK